MAPSLPQYVHEAYRLGFYFKSPFPPPLQLTQVVGKGYAILSFFWSYTPFSLCICGKGTDKRRKTEDRRRIQGLLKHAENFYLSRMLILIFTCRTESQIEVQAGVSRVQGSSTASSTESGGQYGLVIVLRCQLLVQ